MKQTELATAAGLSEISMKNIERWASDPRVSTLKAFRGALEAAGVELIPADDGRGAGVRQRKNRT